MIFDAYEEPPTKEELANAIREAKKVLRKTMTRALLVTAALLLSLCAAAATPMTASWSQFGEFFALVFMVLIVPFLIFTGFAINSRFFLRGLRKMETK